jgi:hypothetical protein
VRGPSVSILHHQSATANRVETNPEKKRGLLQDAIRHYEIRMTLDLNDYYPSCNLPRL